MTEKQCCSCESERISKVTLPSDPRINRIKQLYTHNYMGHEFVIADNHVVSAVEDTLDELESLRIAFDEACRMLEDVHVLISPDCDSPDMSKTAECLRAELSELFRLTGSRSVREVVEFVRGYSRV